MSDLILKLALQAATDAGALPVLADAIEVEGWRAPEHVMASFLRPATAISSAEKATFYTALRMAEEQSPMPLRTTHAVAVAAVLLFASWPTSWPLANALQDGDLLVARGGRFGRLGWYGELSVAPPQPNWRIIVPTEEEIERHRGDPLTVALQTPKESDKQ